MTFTLPESGRLTLNWTGAQYYSTTGTNPGLGVRFKIGGNVVSERITGNNGDSGLENDWLTYGYSDTLSAGTYTITVEWFGGNSNVKLRARTLIAMGTMR